MCIRDRYAGVITKFLDRIRDGKAPIIFGDGSQIRDFIYVKDIANANYLAYALLPGFALALFSNKPYFKWFFAPLFIFAIFATGSRAVELSSIFVIFSYVYHRSDKKIYLIPACIVVIAILVVFFDQIVTNKNYNNSRYVIAKITFNIAKENLINGIGYGQFRKSFRFYIDQNIYNMNNNDINDTLRAYTNGYGWSASVGQNSNQLSPYAYNQSPVQEKMTHNDLLTVVAELGLLGITCVCLLYTSDAADE